MFIALEGIDGSGKSTQVKLLSDNLEKARHKVYNTFEPTDGPIGKIIRDIFNHRIEGDHRVIAGLFVADRLDHLLNKTNGILKKLEEGYTVISDRYCFSSYAYQGTHMSMDWVIQANSLSTELLRPDVNIFIDIEPELSMERLKKGRTSSELYETLENLKNVREQYYEAFQEQIAKERIYIVKGNNTPELVAAEVWDYVSKMGIAP